MTNEHNHHEHGPGCGCGDHEHLHEEEELDVLVLTLDDDSEVECGILDIFPFGEKEYIALIPLEDDNHQVLLYELVQHDNDEIDLNIIEDDQEFDNVSKEFDLRMEAYDDDFVPGEEEE